MFSGKEYQDANLGDGPLGLYDFGARFYDPAIARWLTQDPMRQFLSPYLYCANNPVRFVDPTGMKMTIGDTMTLDYSGGLLNFFDMNGNLMSYTQLSNNALELLGMLRQLDNAYGQHGGLQQLVNSDNSFGVNFGLSNQFRPDNVGLAAGNLSEFQRVTGNYRGSGGSGGYITLNMSSNKPVWLQDERERIYQGYMNPLISLAHELGHALDSDKGLLYPSPASTWQDKSYGDWESMKYSGNGYDYYYFYQGVLKSEWSAVYQENQIRNAMGYDYRSYYYGPGAFSGGRMVDRKGNLIPYTSK